MLHIIETLNDPLIEFIKDDPVRPEIPIDFRVSSNSEIFAIVEQDTPKAIVCVAYRHTVPTNCDELKDTTAPHTIAIFYTIWSYAPGAARLLIRKVRNALPERRPEITRFVTLSPKTEMARKFHLTNGATIFRENETSINYEYN